MYQSEQEIFDVVYRGLAGQGFKRSMATLPGTLYPGCSYRGNDGLKCAIGQLIPDDKYDPSFELGNNVVEGNPNIREAAGIPDHLVSYASSLQQIHDSKETPIGMKYGLHSFAKAHNLTVPEV